MWNNETKIIVTVGDVQINISLKLKYNLLYEKAFPNEVCFLIALYLKMLFRMETICFQYSCCFIRTIIRIARTM